ncbi:MAG TPA: TolC family protein [Gemmatimonadaceae bacterium]|jgi:outer membrane protein TolC|nr:TolC family protein [Gemmatimonadaceae bacterium]
MTHHPLTAALIVSFALTAAKAAAQDTTQVAPGDTLRLGALQDSAVMRSPRGRELTLLLEQSRLRQQNLNAQRLPSLSVEGQAQYQSDVARLPVTLPGGLSVPTPPKDTYDAHVAAGEKLFDPTIGPQRAVENAQLAESQARLRAQLYPLRQNVSDAFFAAAQAQAQIAELQLTITDLEAQLKVATARVREGTALPSEERALRAEILRRRQSVAEAGASRRAALATLADLTGQSYDSTTLLATTDLSTIVARTRDSLAILRSRPEYEQFARARAVLEQQERARRSQDLPRLSAFGRAGYGRPGLNPLANKFETYWVTGLQLQWTPWTWGTSGRDRQILELQRQILDAEEQEFTNTVRRGIESDLANIDRLEAAVKDDDEIVRLRESILTETRARFNEGVVTSAEYVDRQTDVLSARTTRALHRVELAQARARFLNTLGIEAR